MNINNMLSSILKKSGRYTFYSFSNADGKQWFMPAQNMRTAMNLYQPSGIKGKLMKYLFPYLYRINAVSYAIHAERENYMLSPDMKELLCKLFHTNEIEFSIFCGTPCVHQKITMQISKGIQILGYCKFSDNAKIIELFQQEKKTLDYLWQCGIRSVPQCLYCNVSIDGIGIFIQSTTKTLHSITDHQWGERETQFLLKLHNQTKQVLPFGQTDFCQDLCFLYEHLDTLDNFDAELIRKSFLNVLTRLVTEKVEYSFYHADFTPWNIYVEKGQLFTFDLEYAKRTYPPYLDYFHFFTQTAIFEKHLNADKIWTLYQQKKKEQTHLFQDADFAYLSYLLGIVTHYVRREKGVFGGDVQRNMKIWIELIRYLCKIEKK